MARKNCQRPDACEAGARGPCRICTTIDLSAASKAAWADKLSWCPPELIDDYRLLVRHLGAVEARIVIERQLRRAA